LVHVLRHKLTTLCTKLSDKITLILDVVVVVVVLVMVSVVVVVLLLMITK